jgi:DNA repair protein RecN (Recombination protein N)
MLTYLEVKNYIFLKYLSLEFDKGLNIFVGETGAGKSVIIEAISYLCGEKISVPILGSFADKTEIIGVFEIKNCDDEVIEVLKESDIETEEQIIIRREVDKQNKSKCFVNDRLVSLSFLKKLTSFLVDIHGQNEHQKLLSSDAQLAVLDRFAELEELVKNYKNFYNLYKKKLEEKQSLETEIKNLQQQSELLKYQINEIEQAKLTSEDEQLEEELQKAKNAQKVLDILSEIKFNISEVEQKINSIQKLWQSLNQFVKLNSQELLPNTISELDILKEKIEEYKKTFSSYTPDFIDSLVDRVDLIKKLKRKYGNSVEEIKNFYEQAKKQLQEISLNTEYLQKLEEEITKLETDLVNLAKEISYKRKESAKELQKQINKEFASVGLQKAQIEIKIETSQQTKEFLTPTGFNKTNFLVMMNPGSPFLLLKDIASGGELSRIMLAIKTVLGKKENTSVLVFDEIDTGVGGPMGFTIGKKLKLLSLKNKQLFCITHLPQIACFADKVFLVSKHQTKDTTVINVEELDEQKKIEQIARMLSGAKIDSSSIEHAKNLLNQAKKGN